MSVYLKAGYVAFNGYVFCEVDAKGYNVYTEEIERAEKTGNTETVESLKNRRCQYFKMIIGA